MVVLCTLRSVSLASILSLLAKGEKFDSPFLRVYTAKCKVPLTTALAHQLHVCRSLCIKIKKNVLKWENAKLHSHIFCCHLFFIVVYCNSARFFWLPSYNLRFALAAKAVRFLRPALQQQLAQTNISHIGVANEDCVTVVGKRGDGCVVLDDFVKAL